ncbi:MAG: hypothetical protein AAF629_21675 [Chloroflexota bacterium]
MQKTMDAKLADIRSNPNSNAFIIAYAADSDMSRGIPSAGQRHPINPKKPDAYVTMQEYHEDLEAIVEKGDIDILLASVGTMDVLAHEKQIFRDSLVTPAIRANDTTDIWGARGSSYREFPSRPFATTTIEEAQYGTLTPNPGQAPAVNLGLYSATFNNDLERDLETLERFKDFRINATKKGFLYFLEVFNPNAQGAAIAPEDIPNFVNDHICRMLAGIPRSSRPEFLKIAYNSPASMEALVNYDTSVVVGILGGPASTTYDAYKLIYEAKKYGARLTLFGRRIKDAEDSLAFTKILRQVAADTISPEEAVKAYHGALQKQGIKPKRDLETDMVLHTPALLES